MALQEVAGSVTGCDEAISIPKEFPIGKIKYKLEHRWQTKEKYGDARTRSPPIGGAGKTQRH